MKNILCRFYTRKNVLNKILYAALTLFLIVNMCGGTSLGRVTAATVSSVDWSMSGDSSISVTLKDEDGNVITSGELTLYHVADLSETNGNLTYNYTSNFKNIANGTYKTTITVSELTSEIASDSAALAGTLADYVEDNGISGTKVENVSGKVTFDNLEFGLYLIVQTGNSKGYNSANPFIVTLPMSEGNTWIYEVDASPKVGLVTSTGATTEEPNTETPGTTTEDPNTEPPGTTTETGSTTEEDGSTTEDTSGSTTEQKTGTDETTTEASNGKTTESTNGGSDGDSSEGTTEASNGKTTEDTTEDSNGKTSEGTTEDTDGDVTEDTTEDTEGSTTEDTTENTDGDTTNTTPPPTNTNTSGGTPTTTTTTTKLPQTGQLIWPIFVFGGIGAVLFIAGGIMVLVDKRKKQAMQDNSTKPAH